MSQISFAYWSMVLSELNFPEKAVEMMELSVHFSWSWYAALTLSWHSMYDWKSFVDEEVVAMAEALVALEAPEQVVELAGLAERARLDAFHHRRERLRGLELPRGALRPRGLHLGLLDAEEEEVVVADALGESRRWRRRGCR